ncbi:MAG: methyltransferase domain-containing protein [Oscillospiraceae bacterium]|nr:methyltransferase domain-containing protein [Oscillospiraceae bacterium]
MIAKEEVIAFFDRLAPEWDSELVRNEEIIKRILDNAEISEGKCVLDVACGTGVLIPDYLNRGVSSVTGIDISPAMAEIARKKFAQENVTILCGDVEETAFDRQFDCVVVYNAFPHFQDGERLITCLASKLLAGGTLTIAHGMSREKIDAHHHGSAKVVSNGLMSAEELAEIFTQSGLEVTTQISDDRMYQVTGKK